MLYIGESKAARAALRSAVRRGALRRVMRGVYTSDFETDPETVVRQHFLALIGRLLPRSHLSHSSAAMLAPVGSLAFVSGESGYARPLELPGVTVVRLPDLANPEIEWIDAPTLVASGITAEPEIVRVAVSSTLQTVFECLSTARRYPEKQLPLDRMLELIRSLSDEDRSRAEDFARRNGLDAEHRKLTELLATAERSRAMALARAREFDVYFYGWRVGVIAALGSGECRFEYDGEWQTELSRELPLDRTPAYERRGLPAFFDNLLPEGWTESRLRAVFKLDATDEFALLATTEKYLSNLTVRQPGFDADQLAFDAHGIRLEEVAPDSATVLETGQEWELDPGTRRLWIELREKSGVRLSGVQPKLPVGLRREGNELTLALGDLRAPCTHLLKLQSPMYGQLVENEWATMELARQAGLPVPTVRQVEITGEGKRGELALLVERYDIPDSTALEQGGPELRLMLQEDACSLLLLRRARKYEPSLERIADALIAGGLPMDGMETLLRHVAFSWIVGNGDLHAKNISVLRHMVPGRLGRAPRASALTYAPPYDLVCTRLPLRDDEFALPLSGKRNNLRVRDFSAWVERWSMSRERTRTVLEQTVARVQEHLPAVLERSRLPTDEAARYAEVVRRNVERLGL